MDVMGPYAAVIEITPEMIEAGADRVWELRGFEPNYVAEEVFRAMVRASTSFVARGKR
jgi:hypothetical protein